MENIFPPWKLKVQLQEDNLNIYEEQTFLPYQSLQRLQTFFFTQKSRKILIYGITPFSQFPAVNSLLILFSSPHCYSRKNIFDSFTTSNLHFNALSLYTIQPNSKSNFKYTSCLPLNMHYHFKRFQAQVVHILQLLETQ